MFLNTSTPLLPVLNNRAKEHLNDDWSIEKEGGGMRGIKLVDKILKFDFDKIKYCGT